MLLRLFFSDGFQTPAKERGYLERKVRNNLPILRVLALKLSTAGMPNQVELCDGIGLVSCLDTGAIFHKCDASCDMQIMQLSKMGPLSSAQSITWLCLHINHWLLERWWASQIAGVNLKNKL